MSLKGKDPKREIILHSRNLGPSSGFLKSPFRQTMNISITQNPKTSIV